MLTHEEDVRSIVAQVSRDVIMKNYGSEEARLEVIENLIHQSRNPESRARQKTEHHQRQNAAFANWLRVGTDGLASEDKRLLRTSERRDMYEAGLPTGAASGGGILVPAGSEFEHRVMSAMKYTSSLFEICSVIRSANGRPKAFSLDNDATISGEGPLGEGAQTNMADIGSPSQAILGAYRFSSKMLRISKELMADQEVNFDEYLPRTLGVRIARALSPLLTNGSGTNTILGFTQGPNVVNAGTAIGAGANDGTSGANSIGTSDLATLENAVDYAYRANARWMVHPNTLKSLRSQLDKEGRPLFPGLHHSPDGINRLLNYPVEVNTAIDTLQANSSSPQVTAKPIWFADWSRYTVRLVSPFVLIRSLELYADLDALAVVMYARADARWTDTGNCCAFLETVY